MRLLIIEDCPQTMERIKNFLPRLIDAENLAEVLYVSTLAEARRSARTFLPNTVLFDINLPDGKGFEVVAEWQERDIQFLCMSSYPRQYYMDELLAAECLAFIDKNAEKDLFREHLYEALQRALYKLLKKREQVQDYIDAMTENATLKRRLQTTESHLVAIKQGLPVPGFQPSDDPLERFKRSMITLPVKTPNGIETAAAFSRDTILYAEADAKNVHLVLQNQSELVKLSLKEIEDRLSPLDFVRCHKSYIVRVEAIVRASADTLTLSNGDTVPIARTYKEKAVTAINTTFGEDNPNNPFRAKRIRSAAGGGGQAGLERNSLHENDLESADFF